MSTLNHTPVTTGAAANASTFNSPLGQLDAAIGNLAGMGTVATNLAAAIAEHQAAIASSVAAVRASATNTAAGISALTSVGAGTYNAAFGTSALGAVTTGGQNTAIGYAALLSNNASGNVAIGFQAGYFETTGNNFYVSTFPGANEAAGRVKALMYGKFDNDPTLQTLAINAQLIPTTIAFRPIDPPGAPTIGSITAGGSVDAGVHQYVVTFVTSAGETDFGTTSATATATAGNKTINLTAIPVSASSLVTARKIYRTKIADIALGHSNFMYLVATISNNTTTTYTDTASDASIGANPQQYKDNTTSARIYYGSNVAGMVGPSNTSWAYNAFAALTTGFDNSAFGTTALQSLTTGYNNVGIGRGGLAAMTSGNNNVALGTHALQDAVTGESNTALGTNALRFLTASDYNTSVGANSLISNLSGTQNTAVGYAALTTTLGNGNIAVGYQAGYWETGSNKLFIDCFPRTNEADGRASSLIYGVMNTSAASQTLALNANVTMNYRFATLKADGANNAQFIIDSNAQSGGRVRVSAGTGANTPEVYMSLLGVGGTPYGEIACVDTLGWRNLVLCQSGGNVMIGTTTDGMTAAGSLAIGKDLAHRGTKLGFYNTTPITKQTGVAVTAAGIHAACVALGLFAA